jgi:hypothetical protein
MNLERDAHQFLWELGYLVFPTFRIHATRMTGAERVISKEITDLDVFGIRYSQFLEKETFLINCKHRSSERVFGQALKALGIADILNINHLLIVRKSIDETVQRFSELFKVKLVNQEELVSRIKPRDAGSFSSGSHELHKKLFSELNKEQKSIEVRATNAFVDPDPFRKFKTLRLLYNKAKIECSETLSSIYLQYLLYRLIQFAQVAVVEIASETIHLSKHHFENYVLTKMIGDIPFKLRVLEQMNIGEENNPRKRISIEDLHPSYFPPLKELVDRLRRKSHEAQKYLRYNDFIIHEFGVTNTKIDWIQISKEIGTPSRQDYSKWNLLLLEALDEEKVYPSFILELLT